MIRVCVLEPNPAFAEAHVDALATEGFAAFQAPYPVDANDARHSGEIDAEVVLLAVGADVSGANAVLRTVLSRTSGFLILASESQELVGSLRTDDRRIVARLLKPIELEVLAAAIRVAFDQRSRAR